MIRNYKPEHFETIIDYNLVFDDGHFNGFAFGCDAKGNILSDISEEAKKNYQECLNNPEKFVRFNKKVKHEYRVRSNAEGTCSCGNVVELYDMYYGACRCEKCGQWYNVFGQEIYPPSQWEEAFEDD